MSNLITTSDGFVWLRVNDKAKEVFQSGLFELYEINDDESERLIESAEDLNLVLENGYDICIEVGFYNE